MQDPYKTHPSRPLIPSKNRWCYCLLCQLNKQYSAIVMPKKHSRRHMETYHSLVLESHLKIISERFNNQKLIEYDPMLPDFLLCFFGMTIAEYCLLSWQRRQ